MEWIKALFSKPQALHAWNHRLLFNKTNKLKFLGPWKTHHFPNSNYWRIWAGSLGTCISQQKKKKKTERENPSLHWIWTAVSLVVCWQSTDPLEAPFGSERLSASLGPDVTAHLGSQVRGKTESRTWQMHLRWASRREICQVVTDKEDRWLTLWLCSHREAQGVQKNPVQEKE